MHILGVPSRRQDGQSAEWREALPVILGVFAATRLLTLLVAAIVEFALPIAQKPLTWDDRPLLASLTGSDAVYYLGIAEEGYHLEPVKENYRDWVFFPLYPLLVRLVTFVTLGDVTVAGVLVANVALVAAMLALYRLSVDHLGPSRALRAVTYLTIAPGAVAFGMAYSESLFLFVAVAMFLAAEQRRPVLVALFYALAALTRLPGVLLGIPLLILFVQQDGPRPRMAWLALAAGPVAVAAFYAYLGAFTGDFLANLHAQEAWNIPPLVRDGEVPPAVFNPLVLLLIGALVGYVFLFVYVRPDRIGAPYVAMVVVAIATLFIGGRLQSVARYLVVGWPFSWILANRRSSWFIASWPVASTGLFVIHALTHFTQVLAP